MQAGDGKRDRTETKDDGIRPREGDAADGPIESASRKKRHRRCGPERAEEIDAADAGPGKIDCAKASYPELPASAATAAAADVASSAEPIPACAERSEMEQAFENVRRRFLRCESSGVRWISDDSNSRSAAATQQQQKKARAARRDATDGAGTARWNDGSALEKAGVAGLECIEELVTKWIVRPAIFPKAYARVIGACGVGHVGIVGRSGCGKLTAVQSLCQVHGLTLVALDKYCRDDLRDCVAYAVRHVPCVLLFDGITKLFACPGFADEFALQIRGIKFDGVWCVFSSDDAAPFSPPPSECEPLLAASIEWAARQRSFALDATAAPPESPRTAFDLYAGGEQPRGADRWPGCGGGVSPTQRGPSFAGMPAAMPACLDDSPWCGARRRAAAGETMSRGRDAGGVAAAAASAIAACAGGDARGFVPASHFPRECNIYELVGDRVAFVPEIDHTIVSKLLTDVFLPARCRASVDPPLSLTQRMELSLACVGATPRDALDFAAKVAMNALARASTRAAREAFGVAQPARSGEPSAAAAAAASAGAAREAGAPGSAAAASGLECVVTYERDIYPLLGKVDGASISGARPGLLQTSKLTICPFKMRYVEEIASLSSRSMQPLPGQAGAAGSSSRSQALGAAQKFGRRIAADGRTSKSPAPLASSASPVP